MFVQSPVFTATDFYSVLGGWIGHGSMPLEPQRFQLLKTADLLSWDVWAAGGSAQYVFLCWSINLGKREALRVLQESWAVQEETFSVYQANAFSSA